MKKILVVTLAALMLASCGAETDFSELASDKQAEIKAEIEGNISTEMAKTGGKVEDLQSVIEAEFEKIEDKYEDIDFDELEEEVLGKLNVMTK